MASVATNLMVATEAYMVYKRAVRILLECFLVRFCFHFIWNHAKIPLVSIHDGALVTMDQDLQTTSTLLHTRLAVLRIPMETARSWNLFCLI